MSNENAFFKNLPPCQNACPLGTDVRGYINSIARGDQIGALKIIKQTNPLPSVCGRVCHHPCELYCRRGYYDSPLAIRDLKRFASETELLEKREKKIVNEEKIAVVGSGPAGLAAAWQLLELGYSVTLFEKESKPGGLLAFGIPEYRLPFEVLLRDVNELMKEGLEISYNREIGKNLSLDELKDEFSAIVLALGLPLSRSLKIPGIDLEGVWLALPFLRACRLGEPLELGEKVVVIGGGNVAFDVARSAVRKGSRAVVVCLESSSEMPAFPWEIEEAREEGVEIHCSWGPSKIIEKEGRVGGVEFIKCNRVFDDSGRFNPELCEEVKFSLEADTVVLAIGQTHDRQLLDSLGLPCDENGKLSVDSETMAIDEKLFICGEMFLGPSTVVESMASGRKVAFSVHSILKGESIPWLEKVPYPKTVLVSLEIKAPRRKRVPMPKLAPEVRKTNFSEIESGYMPETALSEAKRCLTCLEEVNLDKDKCVSCMNCVRACPFNVPKVKMGYPEIDWARCCGCGVCFSDCPVFALFLKESWEEAFLPQLVETAKKSEGRVRISCDFALPEQREEALTTPCLGRFSTLFYLKALEAGVQSLEVIVCSDEDCRYGEQKRIVKSKLAKAVSFLSEIGQASRLVIVGTEVI